MFPQCSSAVCVLALIAMGQSVAAQDQKLTKVEIGKRGKAATAFVAVPKGGTGTGFCIHPSGLFITNEHVVRGAEKGEVRLVLNPSLDDQRIFKAKVVRVDKALDLALLRVEGAKDLPSLPLGSIKDVAELAEVVACGFPLGFALATEKQQYPAISMNAGSVTALRYKDRELQFIQIDVALNFGNSGGPVLDDHGRVIGVVVSAVAGSKGINLAIPVSVVDRFLMTPDLSLEPRELTRESLKKPIEFKARVVSFVPKAPEPSLKLILQAGDEEPREFPMKAKDGVWVATAPAAAKTAARLEISVRMGAGTIAGTIDDAVFTVGGKPMKLSGVRKIEFKPKPSVLLADGRTVVEGAIAGLGTVEVDVGGQKLKLDLAKATQATVQAAPEVASVSATVVATVDGKEVARFESRLPVKEETPIAVADPSTVKITPPKLDEEKVVKRLPDAFTDVVLGGGGRFLIFHLPKLKKLAVFDINQARVANYIPLTEEDITYAAGLDSLVIGLRKSGKLERWSLTTFELEKTAPPPFREDIKQVVMGHASNGPLVVNGQFLDLATFKPLQITTSKGPWDPNLRPLVSGDGSVFTAWNTRLSPSSSTAFVLEGTTLTRYDGGDLKHVAPGPDGLALFTGKGFVSRTLKHSNADDATYGYCLPAVRGDYFLSLTTGAGGKGGGFTIYLRGLKQHIAKLDSVNHGLTFDGWDREASGPWERVFFIPDANVIVVLPPSNDQIVLHKFDADAALEKSGLDYLIVTSRPPREVKPGTTFTYPTKVKSKNAKVTYRVDSGPKGMQVSAAGVVTWTVPESATPGDQEIIMTIADGGGQEVFHTFTLRVAK